MRASILDLRYKMKDVLKALDRNETIDVLYHGKLKGVLTPVTTDQEQSKTVQKVQDHPFFGSDPGSPLISVDDQMRALRKGRYDDL